MPEVKIGATSSFEDPGRRVVDVAGVQIGVFRLDGEFYAYENRCPHLGGPACQGKMLPLVLEDVGEGGKSAGRVFSKDQLNIICPWHGFEFDIRTGQHVVVSTYRLRPVKVRTDGNDVFITLPRTSGAAR
ncbi:MAG: Rieske (2Fe-2S) protein [Dehalococcoidia bacterium]|jgi:nitrite reductase/ring-hydroxylating ferredoxin subunit|nr:Rieske (2Fe-2S) protein [Dehalococcoidia bacterium]